MAECRDCTSPVSGKSKSGRCRPCARIHLNSDPAIKAKRAAAIKAAHAKPETKARTSAAQKEAVRRNPHLREVRRQNAIKNLHKTLQSEHARAAALDPDVIRRRAQSLSRTLLARAGVPMEYREYYLSLLRTGKGFGRGVPKERAVPIVLAKAHDDRINAIAAKGLEGAIFHLRRLAPVTPKGDGYQYGTVFLTPGQLVERAMQKGWQP